MTEMELNDIIESIIPSWQRAEFHFLEPTPMWAPSVEAEISRMMQAPNAAGSAQSSRDIAEVHCHSHTTTRPILELTQQGRCNGIVLFAKGRMRDVLLCLGRLTRLCCPSPPVLVIIPPDTEALMPLLLESGASGVMRQPVQDTDIAKWCGRIASAEKQ